MRSAKHLAKPLAMGLLAAAGLLWEASATDAVRIVVTAPSAPGSPLDQLARKLAGTLATSGLVSSIDVTDVPGNNGLIGLQKFMAEAGGDGSRTLVVGLPLVAAAVMNRSTVLPSQGTPLARLTGEPQALVVSAASAIRDARDLGRAIKEDPIAIRFAGGTAGGIDHATAGLVAIAAGADASQVNYVPFLNNTEALSALLKNQIDVAIGPYAEFEGQIAAGKLRLVGTTGDERITAIPGPTFKEQGLDVTLVNWKAVVGGPSLPQPQGRRLAETIEAIATSEAWSQVLQGRRWHGAYLGAEGFKAFLAAEEKRMGEVMKALGLVP